MNHELGQKHLPENQSASEAKNGCNKQGVSLFLLGCLNLRGDCCSTRETTAEPFAKIPPAKTQLYEIGMIYELTTISVSIDTIVK